MIPSTNAASASSASTQPDLLEPLPPQQGKKAKKRKWRLHMRPDDDDEENTWWFCSTAIPLLAATTGPLANVMSIAALVTSWRNEYAPDQLGVDAKSIGFKDPRWCLGLNGASLACGFAGNIFLLFNFTRRIRYIVALPATIILWYSATAILIGITICVNEYVPPQHPNQVYSQGFWHAVIAAVLYLVSSVALMLNMLGYFLGHYPQHFELSDEQRNLILQTMLFFFWLAGGAAVFAKIQGWTFVDSLYFCDVTVLTVGFGDLHPTNDVARGLVFPYSVGGIVILGLMVSSINKFASELGSDHVVKGHVERARSQTLKRSATTDVEYEQMQARLFVPDQNHRQPTVSAPFDPKKRAIDFDVEKAEDSVAHKPVKRSPVEKINLRLKRFGSKRSKIIMLKEEKDRFDAMRRIQHETHAFKRYSALTMSVLAFGLLWCVGAIGFWKAEAQTQGLSYFQSLYFCYVSLLTIGYGDLSPVSNAGKPFFIVWSLIAVPIMTILLSDMGDTVIASFKRGTFKLGDWTVLPKAGLWKEFCESHPWLLRWMQRKREEKERKSQAKRAAAGLPVGPEDEDPNASPPTLEDLVQFESLDDNALSRKLAAAIRRTTIDLRVNPRRRYTFEEWAEYTHLIRFSRMTKDELRETEEEEGIVDWDWIGDDSPMLADLSESEWILERLTESVSRVMWKQGLGNERRGAQVRSKDKHL